MALAQTKIHFSVLDIAAKGNWPPLEKYDAVVLSTENIHELSTAQALDMVRYVQGGGGLLVAYRGWHPVLADLFGCRPSTAAPDYLPAGGRGLRFCEELFTGAEGLHIRDEHWEFEHAQLDISKVGLEAGCNILATDDDDRPIAWQYDIAKGRVIYWNTVVLFCRGLRGFALQSLLSVMRCGISSIAGVGVMQVDDFPPSLSLAPSDPAGPELADVRRNDFYLQVWLPDMMKLKKKHSLTYTCYVIMNYHDTDVSSFPEDGAVGNLVDTGELGKRMSAIAGRLEDVEIGFHGYNHEPMTREGWPDLVVAEKKLKLARSMWEEHVSAAMPVSFVPANNWYHEEHLKLLGRVFPEITTVCSLFSTGDASLGGYREFGAEPWNEALLCVPRETCGYMFGPRERMMLLSQIAALGCWTHFIHPDDVFDVPRQDQPGAYVRNVERRYWHTDNPAGLKGLLDELDDWLTTVTTLFPWIDFLTTSKAAVRFQRHSQTTVRITLGYSRAVIESAMPGLYYLRVRDGIDVRPGRGGRIADKKSVFGGTLYTVGCRSGRTEFRLG
ncbi:MAG: DUF2194 domain-containing protein [Nitratireductor sp.]|nr:DUF2194 domain-containing protein [Nitratireductor sp.]